MRSRGWSRTNRRRGRKRRGGILLLLFLVCFGISTGILEKQDDSFAAVLLEKSRQSGLMLAVKSHIPGFYYEIAEPNEEMSAWEYISEQMLGVVPVYGYVRQQRTYELPSESELSYEMIRQLEALDENYVDEETGEVMLADAAEPQPETETEHVQEPETENVDTGEPEAAVPDTGTEEPETQETAADSAPVQPDGTIGAFALQNEPQVVYPREKLNDFDYLIQNFYTVDRTTTINSSQLSAEQLLAKDLHLQTGNDKPQILIYHTHSQELYIDSTPGDVMTGVVGCGEYLKQLLTERYGLNVLHHMGQYDVGDRDHAYANAAPALEQVLAENPSIEVVIDLHRDAVAEDVHLVRTVQGVQMAPVMFFNGLSRLADKGDIDYLKNPYIEDNLAFSLQMKLKASEYYPELTRNIYLKGYRYNMHYCPKTLLVELGAQTNTFGEAKNAMVPLADLLYKVLCE